MIIPSRPIACLNRAQIGHWEIIRLCYNLFDPTWLKGLENAVLSMNRYLEIPYVEDYMSNDLGSLLEANVPRRLILQIGEQFVQQGVVEDEGNS